MKKKIVGRNLEDVFNNFGKYWGELTNDDQFRWVLTDFKKLSIYVRTLNSY